MSLDDSVVVDTGEEGRLAEALLQNDTGIEGSDDSRTLLPSVFSRLLLAQQLLQHRFLRPAGSFFVECFAGTSVFTLGVMFAEVPC